MNSVQISKLTKKYTVLKVRAANTKSNITPYHQKGFSRGQRTRKVQANMVESGHKLDHNHIMGHKS